MDPQKPLALVILTKDELVVHDLQTEKLVFGLLLYVGSGKRLCIFCNFSTFRAEGLGTKVCVIYRAQSIPLIGWHYIKRMCVCRVYFNILLPGGPIGSVGN